MGYWDVKVGRSGDGKLAFEEGWEEFAKRNGLKEEDIVVSEHKGDMVFNAVAYDSGGCEKKYPPDSGVAANRMATSSKARSNKHHRGSKGWMILLLLLQNCGSHSGKFIVTLFHFPPRFTSVYKLKS